MRVQVTVRYGRKRTRYHTERLEVEGLAEALRRLADELPDEVLAGGDLVEIRPAADPDTREYVGDESDPSPPRS